MMHREADMLTCMVSCRMLTVAAWFHTYPMGKNTTTNTLPTRESSADCFRQIVSLRKTSIGVFLCLRQVVVDTEITFVRFTGDAMNNGCFVIYETSDLLFQAAWYVCE